MVGVGATAGRPMKPSQGARRAAMKGPTHLRFGERLELTLGEATSRQAFDSALHGWILAGVIGVLPFFFLVLVFALSREVQRGSRI